MTEAEIKELALLEAILTQRSVSYRSYSGQYHLETSECSKVGKFCELAGTWYPVLEDCE